MDFFVVKKTGDGDTAQDWTPVTIVWGVEDEAEALSQSYSGEEGRYRALPWSDEAEGDLRPGPPVLTMTADREKAAEAS